MYLCIFQDFLLKLALIRNPSPRLCTETDQDILPMDHGQILTSVLQVRLITWGALVNARSFFNALFGIYLSFCVSVCLAVWYSIRANMFSLSLSLLRQNWLCTAVCCSSFIWNTWFWRRSHFCKRPHVSSFPWCSGAELHSPCHGLCSLHRTLCRLSLTVGYHTRHKSCCSHPALHLCHAAQPVHFFHSFPLKELCFNTEHLLICPRDCVTAAIFETLY